MPRVTGRWIGRLVDAAGFEGSLTLELRQRRDSIRGGYEIRLSTHHGEPPQVGSVEGKLDDYHLVLRLIPTDETRAEVELDGDVFDCLGGAGMKGVYQVSPKTYSPLIAGVVAASTEDVSAMDTLVENRERRR